MLFARLPCSVLCLKLFLLFQFQFMVRNLREVSVCTEMPLAVYQPVKPKTIP